MITGNVGPNFMKLGEEVEGKELRSQTANCSADLGTRCDI